MVRITQKEILIIEAADLYYKQNIGEGLKEQSVFIDILLQLQTYLVQSQIAIPEYKNRISTLATKTILNCNSIIALLQGQVIESNCLTKVLKVIDVPSIDILVRAQLENFLMFDFIYCQPKNENELIFRYYNWIYSGLKSRSEFYAKSEYAQKKKKSDLQEIIKYRKIISESDYFKNYSEKQQNRLIKIGDPKLFLSWYELMDRSCIHKAQSKQIYRLISAHAHTTGLSIINLDGSNIKYSENHSQGHLAMFISKILLTKFIILFKDRFKVTELKYNTLPSNILTKIEFYSKILNSNYSFEE